MSDQHRTEEPIFLTALQLATVQERMKYVQAACSGDPELHGRVSKLLASHDAVNGPLDQPLFDIGNASTLDQPSVARLGTQIGPYKLLQVIGEGGMGVVYMAEQTEPVRRRVALKVIKPGMDSQQVIARFEAERQALALMDHVNIARVLDAGTIGLSIDDFQFSIDGKPPEQSAIENRKSKMLVRPISSWNSSTASLSPNTATTTI